MANASAITVNSLSMGGSAALPTADVLDTGTAAVTLAAAVGGLSDRVILLVENTSESDEMTVKVLAGDNPPAVRAGLGDLEVAVAGGATKVIGPLESARFIQNDGTIQVSSTPAATKAQTLKITCFKMPKVG